MSIFTKICVGILVFILTSRIIHHFGELKYVPAGKADAKLLETYVGKYESSQLDNSSKVDKIRIYISGNRMILTDLWSHCNASTNLIEVKLNEINTGWHHYGLMSMGVFKQDLMDKC